MSEHTESSKTNFIRTIIDQDLETGKNGSAVVTRFPPEPNGYLHIGHAKSICLNFGIARDYQSKADKAQCHMRFDDTNPESEDTEFEQAIADDVRWLGFDWGENRFHSSDYFERLYQYAIQLIKAGKAYVCDLTQEQTREYRGTVTEAGKPSPNRDRSVEESLGLFERMRKGEFEDNTRTLRAKIDMSAANMKMRDPLLYRIRHAEHHRTGNDWPIYPMYDYAHCLSDSIEGITHSLCTLEFENNRDVYDWVLDALDLHHPQQIEFARLNINYTVMSKRKLLQLVNEKQVTGWDDPRMLTIAGLRRRGYTPESIRDFCDRAGVAKSAGVVDMAQLEFSIRDDLNTKAPRVMGVINPLKVTLTNIAEDKVELFNAPLYPEDVPRDDTREVHFTRELFIERDDFMEEPPKKYFRLSPGKEVRLRYGYVIKCNEVIKDENGEVVELRCTYDPETANGQTPDGRKVKGIIHWVSATESVPAEVRLYDRLFSHEFPDADKNVDFKTHINSQSLTIAKARLEKSLVSAQGGERYQFERQGYFCVDSVDSKEGALVFNKTVGLKDSWGKVENPKVSAKAESKPNIKPKVVKGEGKKPVAKELTRAETELVESLEKKYGLANADAVTLATHKDLVPFYESAVTTHNNPKEIAKWVINELMRELKDTNIDQLKFGPSQLAELVQLIDDGTISGRIAKDIFETLFQEGGDPKAIVEQKGLKQLDSAADIEPIIDAIMAANPDKVEAYRGGRTKLMGFFVGQAMKETGGRANPKLLNQIVKQKLDV